MERADLEAIVREDPYDDGRWMVLEDWLLEHEDARAPIVRCEKEGMPEIAAGLRAELATELLGPRHAELAIIGEAQWRAGYLVEARILARGRWAKNAEDYRDLIAALLASPAARLLRQLAIDVEGAGDLALAGPLVHTAALRSLELSGFWQPARDAALIDPAWLAPLPLRRLFLKGRGFGLPAGSHLARVRSLMLSPSHPSELDAVLATPLPELRELAIQLQTIELLHGDAPEMRRLLAARSTPALDQLHVVGSATTGRALFDRIARSALLPQLHSLSLGEMRVTPRDYGPAFAHLEILAVPASVAKTVIPSK